MNKVLIITGMHRSGTSLIANWLKNAGLNLGENLIGPTQSNIYGHFEDVDIVEFHEELLRYNETDLYQGLGKPLKFTQNHIFKAKSFVEQRQKNKFWGWKQPRAALFLDLWLEVLPGNTHFLLPFRHYNEVINSLYKREYNKIDQKNPPEIAAIKKEEFIENKNQIVNSYLSMWIRHNKEILRLMGKKNHESLLYFSLDLFIDYNEKIFLFLKEKQGFNVLEKVNLEKIYNPVQLTRKYDDFDLNNDLKTEADNVLEKLNRAESISIKKLGI